MEKVSRPQGLPLISLVFSFRDEEEVLPELISRCRAVLRGQTARGVIRDYELIFVNDSSTDGSLAVLRKASREAGDIRVITTSRPFGVSPCVLLGMEHARGDAVVYLDADLQDPPEVIPEMIQAWRTREDIDVVHTVRRSRAGESIVKIAMTRLGYWILSQATDFKLPVEAGDFKLLSRRVVDHLVRMKEKRPFLRGLVCWIGFNQMFVYYHREPRRRGRTKFPVFGRGVIGNFLDSALISFSSVPLKFALLAGIVTVIGSLGLLMYLTLQPLGLPRLPAEFSVLLLSIFFIGGVQLLSIAIVGLYVGSMFFESKGRPNYIIREMFGFPDETET